MNTNSNISIDQQKMVIGHFLPRFAGDRFGGDNRCSIIGSFRLLNVRNTADLAVVNTLSGDPVERVIPSRDSQYLSFSNEEIQAGRFIRFDIATALVKLGDSLGDDSGESVRILNRRCQINSSPRQP